MDKRINVAYPVDGELEYLTGKDGAPRVFDNQAAAEIQLLQEGVPGGDLQYLHFIEVAA